MYGQLSYRLIDGITNFRIDQNGSLLNLRHFDYENDEEIFVITIEAEDDGGLKGNATFVVEVTDENEFLPVFESNEYNATVVENYVGQVRMITAVDSDGGSVFGSVTYTLEINSALFDIDPTSGEVEVTGILDYEALLSDSIDIVVMATDGGGLESKATVRVYVSDENEFAPVFAESAYNQCINGTPSIGDIMLTISAIDSDRGDNFGSVTNYRILNSSPPFRIDAQGQITVSEQLEGQRGDVYEFDVIAVDGGRRSSQPVTVSLVLCTQVINSPPYFTQLIYNVVVTEETLPSEPIVQLLATDDAFNLTVPEITFELLNHLSLFRINREGSMWLTTPLDFEQVTEYVVKVRASDGSHFSEDNATVLVSVYPVNEHRPKFDQDVYRTVLAENSPPGSLQIEFVLSDEDNNPPNEIISQLGGHGDVQSVIFHSGNYQNFNLSYDQESQVARITNLMSFDFETSPEQISFKVIAQDGGLLNSLPVQVQLSLIDINDVRPVFQRLVYQFSILENSRGIIGEVSAVDTDISSEFNQISYAITHGDVPVPFTIHLNGSLELLRELNYEVDESFFEFSVLATDKGGLDSSASVEITILDVNEFQPIIKNPPTSFEIMENIPIGTVIATITASDEDAGDFGQLEPPQIIGPSHFLGILSNGSLFIESAVDFEALIEAFFNITIEVCDIGQLCVNHRIAVSVLDAHDLPPMFSTHEYTVVISEEQFPDPIPDFPQNALLKLQLDMQNSFSLTFTFQTSSSSLSVDQNGYVILLSPLDFETDPPVNVLIVEAFDGTLRTAQPAIVTVTTINVNDNPPTFISPPTQPFWVSENSIPEVSLYTFLAEDIDDPLAVISFHILNTTEPQRKISGGSFVIMEDGSLHLEEALDYEMVQMIELTVVANDSMLLSDPIMVMINIIGQNDNAPVFKTNYITANLSENKVPGTLSVKILAQDADLPNIAFGQVIADNVRYEIISSSAPFAVNFNEQTGEGTVTNEIMFNYETMETNYELQIRAIDSEGLESVTPVTVVINIIDVNEFPPEFDRELYNSTLVEGSSVFELTVRATDNDGSLEHSSIRYSIFQEEFRANFSISEIGQLELLTEYDYELGPEYIDFAVLAENIDGQLASVASVHIQVLDRNDHSPNFERTSYNLSISEDQEINVSVLQVIAVDGDKSEEYGSIQMYSFLTDNKELPFSIDSQTGDIILTTAVDYELGAIEYTVTIRAEDSEGLFGVASLFISIMDINDNPACPVDSHLTASVIENTLPDGPLLTINVSDPDQLQTTIQFTVFSDYSSQFTINFDGDLYLVQAQDHESLSSLQLNIQVTDDTLVCPFLLNISISIDDVNDNSPQIFPPSAELSIAENNADLILTTFTAFDLDSSPEFSTISGYLVESQESGAAVPFTISNAGVLSAERSLDAEADPAVFRLFVYAIDGQGLKSVPSNITVYVENINDHQPLFQQTEHYVPLHVDTPRGTKILQVTADDDDIGLYGEVTYILLDSTPFSIDAVTGSIYTATNFDSETERNMFVFTIVATDGGGFMAITTVTVELTIDEVFVPEIEQLNYTTCIDENTQLRTPVLTIQVAGTQNYTVGFRIRSDEAIPFEINSQGVVLTSSFLTDFESGKILYTFSVLALNGDVSSEPVMVTVCVNNVNDNPPFFQEIVMAISLEEGYTGFVTDIEALDPDGPVTIVTYSLIGSTRNFRLFSNGSLYLESPLDYELANEATISVIANDTQFQSKALQLTVTVININDNSPEFVNTAYTMELLENEPASTIIEVLRATDADASENFLPQPAFAQIVRYEILESDVPFEVRLDPGTRNGLLVNTRVIDFETDECSYNFSVAAVDGGGLYSEVNASISVLIQNQNDNELKFDNETYYFMLSENTAGPLGSIKVTDKDYLAMKRCPISQSNSLSDIVYTAFGQEGTVTVDNEGQLLVTQPLDYETSNRQLEVVVSAIDGFYSAIATVFIALVDVNEFCPDIRETVATVRIPESTVAGNEIYRIVSMDADGDGDNSNTLFEIVSNNTQLPFSVTEDGGIVLLNKIDFDRNQSFYSFLVRIYDNSGDCNGIFIILRIEVTNINDERPYFVETSYSFVASESLQPNSLVGLISARDLDMFRSEFTFTLQPSSVPFSINSSGYLVLEEALDYEETSRYSFVVQVSDGELRAVEPAEVIVTVGNENDHPPEFIGPFVFNLPENELTSFFVNVIDRDDGEMGEITHYSINSSRNDIFTINDQGAISNMIALDYELMSDSALPHVFTLNVCAYDSGDKRSCDDFTVILQDVNDNTPQFTRPVYTVEILEGESLDSIVQVQATDLDKSAIFSQVQYSFEDSSLTLAAQYSLTLSDNGVLSSTHVFDYESDSIQIVLTVVARDIGGLETTATVMLNIDDQNEFPPQFSQLQYNISVSENLPTGEPFYTFLTTDGDSGPVFGGVQRFIIDSEKQLPFSISANGSMHLSQRINYESGDVIFLFSLTAVDNGGLRSNPVSVILHVLDEEDSPPLFEPLQYNISVRENFLPLQNQPLTRLVVISEAVSISFDITSNEYPEYFEIASSGNLYLKEAVDFESVQEIVLTVRAFDGVLYSEESATVVIKVEPENDNRPVFAEQFLEFSLIENQPQNTLQVSLSATDDDQDLQAPKTQHGEITEYRLLNNSVPFFLTYNRNSRTATLFNSRPLDAETDQSEYTLLIQAYDALGLSAESPAIVIVTVGDEDDNQPTFDQAFYSASIVENVAGFVFTVHATDRDRDFDPETIRYHLSGESSSNFILLPDGRIQNVEAFDYEVDPIEYTFTVSIEGCSDNPTCSASVQVRIEDENDNYPAFVSTKYTLTLASDSFPIQGGIIGRISALDKDKGAVFGTISEYTIRGDSGPFTVHAASGDIIVDDPVKLRQRARTVQFEIVATDGGGLSNSTQVEINVPIFNLHPPVFEQRFYHVTWEENSFHFRLPGLPTNALLQVRAQDLDRPFTTITHYLVAPSDNFQMMEDGFLLLRKPLDWEENSEHYLQVRAYDGLYNSTFNADIRVSVVNQNDNPPEFLETLYQVNVSEHYRTLNLPIVKLLATDLDSSQLQLSYSILDPTAPFRIDFQGNVYVLAQLDYEITKKYKFSVTVSDGSHQTSSPAEVVVRLLDENDHHPFFDQPVYQVSLPENSSPGVFSVSISASDRDSSPQFGEIASYSILESHVPFEISYNPLGEASITNTKELDYENDHHVYVFHIHAYDKGGFRSFFPAQIIVTLLDTDDCPPTFSQGVYKAVLHENAAIPTFVVKVTASDCDVDPQFNRVEFSLENSQGLFSIHPISGIIMSLRSFDLERGQSYYELQVTATSPSDTSLIDTAIVNVTVQDTNEFHPQFVGTPYKVNAPENTTVDTSILTVRATDRDAGSIYGSIESYVIIGNRDSLPFELNLATGQLSLTSPLDYESGLTRYNILVAAVDGGMLLSQTTVEVIVTNIEDEPPSFMQLEYSVSIAENEIDFFLPRLPQNAISQLRATDRDTPVNGLSFNIENSTLQSTFSVDSDGYLYLRHPLDYEIQSSYKLYVTVSDGVFTAQEFAVVTINVINGNDQPPVFYTCLDGCCGNQVLESVVNIEINENTDPKLYFFPIIACDIEGDDLTYTLEGGSDTFEIVNERLTLKIALDYEEQISWALTITASDGIHESTMEVSFEVINANDNPLEFIEDEYSVVITENTALHLSVKATDKDLPDAAIEYSIQQSNELPFELRQGQDGAIISSTKPFDFESNMEWYRFNVTAHSQQNENIETAVAEIYVVVKDVNEYRPVFTSKQYNSSVFENTMGSVIAKVTATDADSGDVYGHVVYSLIDSPSLPCAINENGEIIHTEPVDAERGPTTLEMTVEAIDGGGLKDSALVLVSILDVNDNKPFFSPVNYYALVPENAPIQEVVMTISADDNDQSKDYSAISGYTIESSQEVPFEIDSSGSIKLSSTLDYESGPKTYSFSVSAVDSGGLTSEIPARVTIDIANVPDQPPIFSQSFYSASIRENSQNGTFVTQLSVSSPDGGSVNCYIMNSDNLPFSIGKQSAIISVSGAVDHEQHTFFEIVVACYSNTNTSSETSVQIIVLNVNDYPPVFGQTVYRSTIVENSPRGSLSLEIQATDLDKGNAGMIHRFLIYQSTNSFFVESFNQSSGRAVISNLIPFDYEAIKSVEVQVRAIDRGSPPLYSDPVTIIVDIQDENDNAPIFTQDVYFTTLAENTVGPVISTSVTDLDHGNRSGNIFDYQIQPPTHPFTISDNGLISISEAIDYESFGSVSETRIQFSVRAFDGYGLASRPAIVLVNILNENDNTPRPMYTSEWPVKTVQLEWGIPVSALPVFTLTAVDDDKSDSLFYFLETVAPEFPFTLPHLKSGEMILQRPLTGLTSYHFAVTVQDRHPLFFLPDTNSIRWEVQVEIIDTNSPPYFSTSQFFQQITITRGRIGLNRPLLQLIARDDDFPESSFATIERYTVTPIDLFNSQLNTTNNLPFSVTVNGELVVTAPPIENQYAFTVAAVDGGGLITQRAVAITIFIQDGNDFAPAFESQQLRVSLPVSADIGSVVTEISISDGDEGLGGQVECFLQGSVSYFTIDLEMCTVYVAKSLLNNNLEGMEFDITITATDKGSPPLSTSANLHITIESGRLELIQNITEVMFVEEGGPVKLTNSFELDNNRLSSDAQYSLSVSITPALSGMFNPDFYSSQCLAGGNEVNLLDCFSNANNLFSESSNTDRPTRLLSNNVPTPVSVRRGSSTNFMFQTWIKTDHIGARNLLGAYSTNDVTQNDPLFLIQVSQTSVLIIAGGRRIAYSINFQSSVLLNNNWHHLLVSVTSQDSFTVYVDGSKEGSVLFDYDFNDFSDQVYIYTDTLKGEESTISIFTTLLWKASFKFNFEQNNLISSLTCMLSCGETLNTNISGDAELTWDISAGRIEARTKNFETISRMLTQLSYDNKASEPLAHSRLVTVTVADDRSHSNATVSIVTALRNEHTAILDLNINSRKDVFYYVAPSRSPYPAGLASNLLLTDMDSTQTDYQARVEILTLNGRSCDRLDYSPKIKLEQCLSKSGIQTVPNVFNLLPIHQWGLHTLSNVRTLQLSLFGYYFYSKGIFIPDTSTYKNLELSPDKFSIMFWMQYSAPGTIVHVKNATMNFMVTVRANGTDISLDYLNEHRPTTSLFWSWNPREEWTHVSLSLNRNIFSLCIDGTECSSQSLPVTSTPNTFTGIEAFVGAFPGETLLDSSDRYTGTLNGLALISDYVIPMNILNCVIECAEKIVFTSPSVLDNPLTTLLDFHSTGIASANGTLQIASDLKVTELQQVLRQAAYINSHPYQYSGTRNILYSVYDGNTLVKPRTTARLSVHVLHHQQRAVSLLRLGRQTLTTASIVSGAHPFTSTGISSDTKSNTLDSLLVEMTSTPSSLPSCYRSQSVTTDQCKSLFSIDRSLLLRTNLEVIVKPTKLLIYGLSNVTYYGKLLHQITIQSDDPSSVVTASSEVSIKVYISDMNGIASNSRTTTIFVQDSSAGARKKRSVVNDSTVTTNGSLTFITLLVSCALVIALVVIGVFFVCLIAKH